MPQPVTFLPPHQLRLGLRLGQYAGLIILAAGLVILLAATALAPRSLAGESVPRVAATGTDMVFGFCARPKQTNCVIDGDTLRLGAQTIRLADIDAPETHDPKCPSELALGNRATQRLITVLNLGPFEIMPYGRDTDKYGRALRLVTRNGVSVAVTLVSEGLARPWDGSRHPWCI